jgi:Ser/Thr protein kinase RdoA (MazF antagonist)
MMKLSIMKGLLHSPSHKEYVTSALKMWGYEEDSVEFVRASSNFVYTFKRGNTTLVLRLSPKTDRASLEREVEFLSFLDSGGLSVNRPVNSVNGNKIENITTEFGIFHAVVLTYFDGCHLDVHDISDSQLAIWGETLGRLHQLSKKVGVPDKSPGLESMISKVENQPSLVPSVEKEAEYLLGWLQTLGKDRETYGQIHFDFELDNIIWVGNNPNIIDFESGLSSWYTADIAYALRDLFEEGVDLSDRQVRLFLDGYRRAASLSDSEIQRIPMFIRVHNLITYKMLRESMDENTESGQPEWVNELITKLKNKLLHIEKEFKTFHS